MLLNKEIDWMKNNKDRLSILLVNIFMIVFMITFTYLVICLVVNNYKFTSFHYGLLVLGMFFIIGLFYLIMKKQKVLFQNKKINIFLLIVYFIFQLGIIYCFAVRPTWDFGGVYYLSRDVASGTRKFTSIYYLYICDNNIPISAFFSLLYKPLYLLKLEKLTGVVSLLINAFAIDIGLFYLYKILKMIHYPFFVIQLQEQAFPF